MIARAALLLLLAAPAAAQVPPPATVTPVPAPVPAPAPVADEVRVVLTTALGAITVALDRGRAPVTTANFLRYVDQKKFDGIAFYRAMNLPNAAGLIQFGTRNEPKRTLPPIAFEPTTRTGLSHTDGTLSMAMEQPGTARGDVFITIGDLRSLDAKGTDPGFAAFGRVVEGMDVVRAILAAPTDPAAGEGAMKGQMLAPVVTIRSARRLP